MSDSFYCFKHKETGMFYGSWPESNNPEKAYPKYGNQGSAFCHADEYFEGQVEAKCRFRNDYEIVRIDRENNNAM